MRFTVLSFFCLLAAVSVSRWRGEATRLERTCAWVRGAGECCGQGRLEKLAQERWELVGTRLTSPLTEEGVRIAVRGEIGRAAGWAGRRVHFCAPLRCVDAKRNPSSREDGLWRFRVPRMSAAADRVRWISSEGSGSLRQVARSRIERSLEHHPQLMALALAVWVADLSRLPETLVHFYRDTGLLFVLALSGQHVLVLAGLLSLLVRGLVRVFLLLRLPPRSLGAVKRLSDLYAPLISALLLMLVSSAPASIRRATAMVAASALLRVRGVRGGVFRILGTSAALLIVWDPGLVADAGFLLSVLTTAAVVQIYTIRTRGAYFAASLFVPLVAAPLVLFLFSQISWLSAAYAILLTGVWSVLWIPLGFVAPWFPVVPFLADWAEWVFDAYLFVEARWIDSGPTGLMVFYRFSLVELFGWYAMTWGVVSRVIPAITKDKPLME